jgi:hypothetical protein
VRRFTDADAASVSTIGKDAGIELPTMTGLVEETRETPTILGPPCRKSSKV